MALRLNQLVYTSFHGVGFRTLTSDKVSPEIQQAFIQQIIHPYWNPNQPYEAEYQAAYLDQITPGDCLFGWVYTDEHDDLDPKPIPYFICYHLSSKLDPALLDCIFTCLQQGPIKWLDRQSPPNTLQTLDFLEFEHYQSARTGVVVPQDFREESYAALARKEPLSLFFTSLGTIQPSTHEQNNQRVFKHLKRRQRPTRPIHQRVTRVLLVSAGLTGFVLLLLLNQPRWLSPSGLMTKLTPKKSQSPSSEPGSSPSVPQQTSPSSILLPSIAESELSSPKEGISGISFAATPRPPSLTQPNPNPFDQGLPRLQKPIARSLPPPGYKPVIVPTKRDTLLSPPSFPVSIVLLPSKFKGKSNSSRSIAADPVQNDSTTSLTASGQSPSGSGGAGLPGSQRETGELSQAVRPSELLAQAPESGEKNNNQPDSTTSNSTEIQNQSAAVPQQSQAAKGEANAPTQPPVRPITTLDIANAITRGLVIADRNGEVPYLSRDYLKMQDVIYRLRLGQNWHYAARQSGVSQSLVKKLLTLGGLPPAKT